MRIRTNTAAAHALIQLDKTRRKQAKVTERLSSGFQVNRAADNAAGLSISEKLRSRIRGVHRACANIQDGISMLQAADSALQGSHDILHRIRELALQGANDINAPEDRIAVMDEIEQLCLELDRIADSVDFNGKYILSGLYCDFDSPYVDNHFNPRWDADDLIGRIFLQAGADPVCQDAIPLSFSSVNAHSLLTFVDTDDDPTFWQAPDGTGKRGMLIRQGCNAVGPGFLPIEDGTLEAQGYPYVWSVNAFHSLVNVIDGLNEDGTQPEEWADPKTGIARVSELRVQLGAVQNRLEHAMSSLGNTGENLQAAESRIRDADVAKEMMELAKDQVLSQSAAAMLSQASKIPQSVLQLLG
ncbi:MAG: flagellin [Oscillospiraceae bacterium]|nr:flagellin [Oscillospiraceae bacterium]